MCMQGIRLVVPIVPYGLLVVVIGDKDGSVLHKKLVAEGIHTCLISVKLNISLEYLVPTLTIDWYYWEWVIGIKIALTLVLVQLEFTCT